MCVCVCVSLSLVEESDATVVTANDEGWGSGRPLNSHGATVKLTVSAVISRSHGGGLISHGLLSVSTTDLPVNTTAGFNRFSGR